MHKMGGLIALIAGWIAMYFSDGANIPDKQRMTGLWLFMIGIVIFIPTFITLIIMRYRVKNPLISHRAFVVTTVVFVSIICLTSTIFWGWVSSLVMMISLVSFFYYLCLWVEKEELKIKRGR